MAFNSSTDGDNLEEVVTVWQEYLAKLNNIGNYCFEIEENRSTFLVSRKTLQQETKEFKKLSDEGKIESVESLVKLYQNEINTLVKRAKGAEAQFQEMYQFLFNAPDLCHVVRDLQAKSQGQAQELTETATKCKSLQIQLDDVHTQLLQEQQQSRQLKGIVQDYDDEFKTVKNQDVTVRSLEEKITEMEGELKKKAQTVAAARDAYWEERLDQLETSRQIGIDSLQKALNDKDGDLKVVANDLRRSEEQHLQSKRGYESRLLAQKEQIELLNGEIQSKRDHAGPTAGDQSKDGSLAKVTALEEALTASKLRSSSLEEQLQSLRSQFDKLVYEQNKGNMKSEEEKRAAAASSDGLKKTIALLESKLSSRPTQEEVSHLREALLNAKIVENCDIGGGTTDLEKRLLVRQKQNESLCVSYRSKIEELEQQIGEVQGVNRSLGDDLKDAKLFAKKLEQECSKIRQDPQWMATGPGNPNLAQVGADIVSESARSGGESGSQQNEQPSIVDIALGQRDRLRQKLLEAEQSRDDWRTVAEAEKLKTDKLHADNVSLVESIKYLKQFRTTKEDKSVSMLSRQDDVALEEYGEAYESRVAQEAASDLETGAGPFTIRGRSADSSTNDPYNKFRCTERLRKIHGLSTPERLIVKYGNMILAARPTRLVGIAYLLSLHCLVAMILIKMTMSAV